MKIAVATNDHIHVTGHIGRCRSFMLYDIENGRITKKELRNNSFTAHGTKDASQHDHHHGEGAGHHHTRLIEGLKECTYLISAGGGWRVVEDLKAHNIITLFTDEESVDAAVVKFINGELHHREDRVCTHHA